MQNNNISKPHTPLCKPFFLCLVAQQTDEASWFLVTLDCMFLSRPLHLLFTAFSQTYSSVTATIFLPVLVDCELLILVGEKWFLHSWT